MRSKHRVPGWCGHCERGFADGEHHIWIREYETYVHLECLMFFAEANFNHADRLRLFAVYRYLKQQERLS